MHNLGRLWFHSGRLPQHTLIQLNLTTVAGIALSMLLMDEHTHRKSRGKIKFAFVQLGFIIKFVPYRRNAFIFLLASSNTRTATEMDRTLHTDFQKSETSRDIKKYF